MAKKDNGKAKKDDLELTKETKEPETPSPNQENGNKKDSDYPNDFST